MMKEKIGNCFPYIKNGLNIKQDKNKGGIPITRIETLSNDRFNRDKMGYADIFDVEKYSDRILCDGDILMSHINSSRYLGRAVLYQKQNNENIIHGVNLLRLKADRSIVYPNYAAKFFASRYFKKQVVSITKKAVNQASFSIAALKELEIQLPDLDTQKRIAQNFEKISNCIFTLEEYLNKLDDLVKSRFMEMFGDPVADVIWPCKRLDEICTIVTGNTPSRKDPSNYGDCVEWCKTDNITDAKYLTAASEMLSEKGASKGRVVPAGSILMACIAGSVKSIGKVAVADRSVAFNQQINALVLSEKIDVEYLLWALRLSKDYLCSGVNMQLKGILNKTSLSAKRFCVPPLSLQQEFAAFVHQVDKLKFDLGICLFILREETFRLSG